MKEEARNNLMLGLCSNLKLGLVASSSAPLLIRFMQGQKLLSAALQTPPNPLVLSLAPKEYPQKLVATLLDRKAEIPSVVGPPEEAQAFAELWCKARSVSSKLAMSQGIYQLERVLLPPPVPGILRVAEADDVPQLVQWMNEFNGEALPNNPPAMAETQKKVEQMVRVKALFVWERGGKALAMAGSWGQTPNGIRINAVYTPPSYRGQGSASRLVAELSQAKLDSGKKFCFLYTDLNNPTSNRIYQKIGYEFVCESRQYHFVAEK